MLSSIRTWLLPLCFAWLALGAEAAPLLYVANEDDPLLHVVDAADAATVSTHTVSLVGETVLGSSGLARSPLNGLLYELLWLDGQAGRERVTLDEAPGNLGTAITRIGDTGDLFSAIAFDANGVLYGLTHDDAATPSALFTLSLADAAPTLEAALGYGGFGEALGYDAATGLLYHASGYPGDDPLSEVAFEACRVAFDEALGATGAIHAFRLPAALPLPLGAR